MKKRILVLYFVSTFAFSQPGPVIEHSKLLWQEIVALTELVFLPEGPSSARVGAQAAGGLLTAAGGLGLMVTNGPKWRRATGGGAATVAGLTAVGVINEASKAEKLKADADKLRSEEAARINKSEVVRQIVARVGNERAAELIADLRAHTGLARLVRDYGDARQSAGFLVKLRTEREKLSKLVPEHVMDKEEREKFLDIGAARRAVMMLVMETSTEEQKAALSKKLDEDLAAVADAMKAVTPPPMRPHAGNQPSTH